VKRILGATGLALLNAATARAFDLQYVEPTAPPAPSMWGLVLRTCVALAVVLALVYAVAWLLKKAQPGLTRSSRKGSVEVETHVPLGPKRSLYSVRWGRFRLLLGAGTSEIALLASEWTGEENAQDLARAELPDEAHFGRHLDDFLSRLGRMEDEAGA
jgi:flagellar biogenesis protein FliO